MSFCSIAIFALFAFVVSANAASLVNQPRIRSVVRVDSRGHLVRTIVMSPRIVASDRPLTSEVPELIEAAAKKYDVDPLLIHSMISVESAFNPYAVSYKGAQGLMQLMPDTARRFGVQNSFDPRENIEGGVRYLKYLDGLFPNDLELKIAAYNAGEGAVWKYNNRIPPYRETEQYVQKVGTRYDKARREAERKKAEQKPPIAVTEPQQESYSSVAHFIDADGRLHLRTP